MSVVWRLVVVIVRKISSDAEMCVEFLGVLGLNCYVVFSLNTKQVSEPDGVCHLVWSDCVAISFSILRDISTEDVCWVLGESRLNSCV